MMNMIEINEYRAVIRYDPEIEMFRGEFLGLNGGADFYAKDVDGLRKEGKTSLEVFLEMCKEKGVEPRKEYTGQLNLHVPPTLHEKIATSAAVSGKGLSEWVAEALDRSVSLTVELEPN